MPRIKLVESEALPFLKTLESESIDFIYVDPPFNTKKTQKRLLTGLSYEDNFGDSFEAWIRPHMKEAWRILKSEGSFFFHIDHHESHYCKIWLDEVFGRDCFMNEIIWAYDYGGRSKKKWSAKHDTLFWYAKDHKHYTFNFDEMDRIPYMAPGLVGKEKAARGKSPTDTWWHTIVPTNGTEKTGYPTQKPLGVLNRIIKVHTKPGDLVLDFFAGSGTTGESAATLGRDVILVDRNPQAITVMKNRLARFLEED